MSQVFKAFPVVQHQKVSGQGIDLRKAKRQGSPSPTRQGRKRELGRVLSVGETVCKSKRERQKTGRFLGERHRAKIWSKCRLKSQYDQTTRLNAASGWNVLFLTSVTLMQATQI